MGILAYTVYANLIYMCRSWITDGAIPSILGMWWIHVLVLISALIWLQRQGRVVGKG